MIFLLQGHCWVNFQLWFGYLTQAPWRRWQQICRIIMLETRTCKQWQSIWFCFTIRGRQWVDVFILQIQGFLSVNRRLSHCRHDIYSNDFFSSLAVTKTWTHRLLKDAGKTNKYQTICVQRIENPVWIMRNFELMTDKCWQHRHDQRISEVHEDVSKETTVAFSPVYHERQVEQEWTPICQGIKIHAIVVPARCWVRRSYAKSILNISNKKLCN